MPVFQSKYIYPKFEQQLIKNSEIYAQRIASHVRRDLLKQSPDGEIILSEYILNELKNIQKELGLSKIKLYSKTGETLFSSVKEDIGKLNTKDYFHNIVAKGKIYTMVVSKNTKSLEDEIVSMDVVETYIPILNDGIFIGAFEIYYNITTRKNAMNKLIFRSNMLLTISTTIIVIIVLFSMIMLKRQMQERQRFERSLLKMANTDKLTGLFNRRRFEDMLQVEINQFKRYKHNLSLLMIDIDNFKKVNDQYGHLVGDSVLSDLSKLLKETVRESDIIARFGGEEFIAIIRENDITTALEVAERLRKNVEQATFSTNEGMLKVTISIGLAQFCDQTTLTSDSIVKAADDFLYQAKNNGRNQVAFLFDKKMAG